MGWEKTWLTILGLSVCTAIAVGIIFLIVVAILYALKEIKEDLKNG